MTIDPSVSALIRDVLAEELAKLNAARLPRPTRPDPTHDGQWVTIAESSDIQTLIARLRGIAVDPAKKQGLKNGDVTFRLCTKTEGTSAATPMASSYNHLPSAGSGHSSEIVVIDKGFLSERHVERLSSTTKRVKIGKKVKLTPLARDRLRQRGITIERTEE